MECNIKYFLLFALFVFSVTAEEKAVRFVPNKYTLEIVTTEEHFKDSDKALEFSGTVTVDFKRENQLPADKDFEIKLDANPKTKITGLTLKEKDREVIEIVKKEIKNGKLVITVPKEKVGVENFELTVKFTNPFGDDMSGFYRSSYKEVEGGKEVTRWLLTTHFEPIYARDAFPCFDQPDLKAKFIIKITVPKDIKTVLSNTPEIKVDGPEAGPKTYTFTETPYPMSTYLVAFTASNLVGTNAEDFGTGQKLRTFGRKEIIDRGDAVIPQRVAKGAVLQLGQYLGKPYDFGKVDQIGIPDFSAGAMENWGHISFREKALFFNDKSARNNIQSNTLTIIHELVHQWFGNLVTLENWNYIWLNEAFANYLEYVIGSQLTDFKNWNLMDQIVVNEIHSRAFETDGLESSKALNYKIPNENLIVSFFNDIPYAKGAAVLRMWNFQLGDKFQEALKKYIEARKTNTANPTQLLNAFKEFGMKDDVFKSWTDQPGYPVVDLIRINSTHYNITQNRFFWEKVKDDKSVWQIPISFSTNKDPNFNPGVKRWLGADPVPTKKVWDWVIANNHQAGYYRVNYDKENWEAISKALTAGNYSNIPVLNRAQVINDVFSLARSLQKEYVDYSVAFKLSKYLCNETNYVPWKTALNAFDFLKTKLYNEKFYTKFQDHILSLAQSHFKGLVPKDELDHVAKLKNIEISRWLCSLGFKKCVEEAQSLYKEGKYKENADTQEIVLCTVVVNDTKIWNDVFSAYLQEKDSSKKLMYLSALGCNNNQTIIEGYLNKTLESKSGIRKQDLKYVLSSVYNGNFKNIEIAFKFIENNAEKIATQYGGLDPLGGALIGIARKLKTKDQLTRMEALVKKVKENSKLSGSANNADNAVSITKSNYNWVQGRMKQIDTYFNSGSLLSYSFALLLLCLISVFQF